MCKTIYFPFSYASIGAVPINPMSDEGGHSMQIQTFYGRGKRKHIDVFNVISQLDELHPQVASIIAQVRSSHQISQADKSMIEQQLLSMCGTLNEVKTYTIIPGRWKKNDVYSDLRAKEADENKTIRNETVFTIISYGKRKHWTVYIDLPIDVAI